ncbi:MAG TPA: rhomboid family intramembrane serine protease [Sedimentisphaerales bacterium]|nr:rhomboid family intramembrane serine protease [Sedimentisphaerales bacterium]
MIFLPIRTSIQPRRTPYANYALVAVNVAIFLLSYFPVESLGGEPEYIRHWADQFVLDPRPGHLFLWQFVSYAFLHAGFMHIAGNMFFLYLFGNNVNDKLGHIGYLSFYLAGAVFSGIGHTLLSSSPVLGASGAIAAVTGAYLVLFPQTLITIIYWFFFIGTIELPAMYFIAFKLIIWDNIFEPSIAPPVAVAYGAHLAGYIFGIGAMVVLLATHILSGSNYDLWAMIKLWNRRRSYRDVVSSGYDPYTGRTKIKVKEVIKSAAEQQKEEQLRQLRSEISDRMLQRNLPAAAELFIELMEQDSEQILPSKQLLDIANQLAGDNKHAESARAYEQLLSHYSTYEYAEQVELMLGIIYARYLNQPGSAEKHLQIAEKKLTDPGQLKMCRDELARIKKA